MISEHVMHQEVEHVLYYVTMKELSGKERVAFLLGPYISYDEAWKQVHEGQRLACAVNDYHWFDSFGVSSLPANMKPPVHFAATDAAGKLFDRSATVQTPTQPSLNFGEDRQAAGA